MEKVLVVGSNGFIGRELVSLLGERALCLDSSSSSTAIDITDFSALEKFFSENNFSSCVNLAAMSILSDCEKNPSRAFRVNVIGTLNLLELCSRKGVDFCLASSVKVYGKQKKVLEKSILLPDSVYARTKAVSEGLVREYCSLGLIKKGVVLRFTNVFGFDEHKDRLIPKMISQALSGRVKLTHAKTKFDLVYSKDIARAVLLALEKTKGFEIFNVSSGKPISLISLAKKIISLCNKKAQIKVISNDDQHNPIISSKKISSLGWKASSFDDSLKSVVEFYSKKN